SSSSTTSRPMSSADTSAEHRPAATRAPGLVHALGASVLDIARDVRDLLALFALTVRLVARGRVDRRMVLEQMHEIGNKSVFFVTVTMGFIGMILTFQSALQALKIV